MQLTFDFDYGLESNTIIWLIWLKRSSWYVIYRWEHYHIDRRGIRARRILDKLCISMSQADFMQVKTNYEP